MHLPLLLPGAAKPASSIRTAAASAKLSPAACPWLCRRQHCPPCLPAHLPRPTHLRPPPWRMVLHELNLPRPLVPQPRLAIPSTPLASPVAKPIPASSNPNLGIILATYVICVRSCTTVVKMKPQAPQQRRRLEDTVDMVDTCIMAEVVHH